MRWQRCRSTQPDPSAFPAQSIRCILPGAYDRSHTKSVCGPPIFAMLAAAYLDPPRRQLLGKRERCGGLPGQRRRKRISATTRPMRAIGGLDRSWCLRPIASGGGPPIDRLPGIIPEESAAMIPPRATTGWRGDKGQRPAAPVPDQLTGRAPAAYKLTDPFSFR